MSGIFGSPAPAPQAQAPIPQEDDEAARRAALRERTRLLTQPSGRLANALGQTATAKSSYTPAETRKGLSPPGVIGPALLTG
jgi:hypothetical protein